MQAVLAPEIKSIVDAVHFRPAISVVMPFEPKMSGSNGLAQSLKTAARKIERELLDKYPSDIVLMMMQKLNTIFQHLNYATHKKSIAIFLSPVYEKVLYLDIAVEAKIIVDESFGIRGLVSCKKQLRRYLVLQLNERESRMYLGSSTGLIKIVSGIPGAAVAAADDPLLKTTDFSDNRPRKEILIRKLLQQVENTLHIILNAYPLPLFVIGPERLLGQFRNISKHRHAIVEYIREDYCDANEKELNAILEPHIADWKKVIQKDWHNQLNAAAGAGKLVTGMDAVRRDAAAGKGRLLLVEKNFMYATADNGCRNTVDETIEKVLENGGDVEFTDQGFLQTHDHIALIKYD